MLLKHMVKETLFFITTRNVFAKPEIFILKDRNA